MQKLSAYDIPLTTLAGTPLEPAELRGRAALIVNVASRCGLTPQYEGLQRVYDRYRDRGLVVVGVPCDQFANQEPGSADEIAEFCSAEYNVTFPLTEKLSVNGNLRHPLFGLLTEVPDRVGTAGDVEWNFEKFLVSPRGEPVARFRPTTLPEDVEVTQAIEAHLPESFPPVWSTRAVQDVRVGDRVITPSGNELTVSRIEERFLDREDLICLIEDTAVRWLAQPVRVDRRRADSRLRNGADTGYGSPVARPPDVALSASELRVVLGQILRRLRAEHQFPISQGTVLARLEREGPATTSALAAAERVRPQSMAQTIAELGAAGLVARSPDPTDGRQILIELTERGRTTLAEERARREGWLASAIESELTAEEQETLLRALPILRRLAQS